MPVMVCITIDHPKQCQTKYVEDVTRHISGALNGMGTDIMSGGRTKFMRYGKGPRGRNGITVKPNKRKSPGSYIQGSYFDHQECSIIM